MSGRIENILPLLACVIPLGCPDCSATASAPMERKGGLSFPPFPLVCYCCCCCLYCARGERDVRKKKTHTQSARFDARSRVPSAMKKMITLILFLLLLSIAANFPFLHRRHCCCCRRCVVCGEKLVSSFFLPRVYLV